MEKMEIKKLLETIKSICEREQGDWFGVNEIYCPIDKIPFKTIYSLIEEHENIQIK